MKGSLNKTRWQTDVHSVNVHRLEPVLKLVGYCHDFLRGSRGEAKGRLHLRRGAARRGYLDVAALVREEKLLSSEAGELLIRSTHQAEVPVSLDDVGIEFHDLERANGDFEEAGVPRTTEQTGGSFDVLRRLYGLVQGNAHELECIYGAFFLEGSNHAGKPILAPLVTAPVSIQYDTELDAIRVVCEHDYARLNTYAISELFPDSYDAMEESLRELAQFPLPLDLKCVNRVVRILQTVGGLAEVPQEVIRDASALRDLELQNLVTDTSLPNGLSLRRYAAVAVVRRGNVFVLDDLTQMTELCPEDFEGSLLARFALGEEAFDRNGIPRKRSFLGEGEILFPFAANNRQIQVAHAIERHGLIRVQGPPGTGKSQTIANLVCHLIAQGKRVLVASQQQKAVEVVQNYLEKLGIDFLPMTLLKGDREAMRVLKSRLDGLTAFAFDRTAEGLRRKGEAAERKVAELRQRILDLEGELGRSLDFEKTPWGQTGKKPGELASEYVDCQGNDTMAQEESVTWGQKAEVSRLLEQVAVLSRELKGHRTELAQLIESTELPPVYEIEVLLEDLRTVRDVLEAEVSICRRDKGAEIRKLPLFPVESACTPEAVGFLREMLRRHIQRLAIPVGKENSQTEIARTVDYDQATCRAYLESLEEFQKALLELCELEEKAAGCGVGGVGPAQLDEALEVYQATRMRWWRWLSPSFMSSRRIVAKALGRQVLTFNTDIRPVRARVQANQLRMKLSELKTRRLSHLGVPEIPAHFDMCAQKELGFFISAVRTALKTRESACELSTAITSTLGHELSVDLLVDRENLDDIHDQIFRIEKALVAARCEERAKALAEKWKLWFRGGPLAVLAEAVQSGTVEKAQYIVSLLESLLPLVPTYRDIDILLEGPLAPWRRSAEAWIRRAEELPTLDFRTEIDSQVHAAVLRSELRTADSAAPRESAEISSEIRNTEEKYRQSARAAVDGYLHAHIVSAYIKPEIGNEVRYFTRILQKGKRNFEAFLKLKRSPKTFESVLSVLPCWVATIQDVARVFPLQSGLFDIVIIDEASQCSIPSALPLFLRSQKAVVVGDDKQLPCVEGKFVSRTYNEELIKRHRLLETLPRPECFNACDSSLFDLAGSFTEQPVFLAEHFRSHPDIIAFSNRRFYDDRLLILTHGMDQSLGQPTELIFVDRASDDLQAKINRTEAEAVVQKLRELINDQRYEGMEFGVCSPFRNQADFIWELILKEFTDKEIQDRKLVSATADGFQGDERDVILYSFRYAPNSSPRIFTLADGVEGQQRMNVAITRPRRRALCFISHSLESFPPGLVRDYLRYSADPRTTVLDGEPWDSQFEKDVHGFLERKGLDVRAQVRACGYTLDFLLRGPDGRIAALEADGWEIHYPDGRLREEDIRRQRVLERAGWTVFRVHSRAFYRGPEIALRHVLDYFAPDEDRGDDVEAALGEEQENGQTMEDLLESPGILELERIDPKKIPLHEIQKALRYLSPEPGVEVLRDELFRRALPQLRLHRLGKRVRDRFQSAMNGLIRKGEFGHRGPHYVWRLKSTETENTGNRIPLAVGTSQQWESDESGPGTNSSVQEKAWQALSVDDFFQPMTYQEMGNADRSISPPIYKCSYCGFYIRSDDPSNPTSTMCRHIEENHPGAGTSRFRVISDLNEIRENA